MTADQFAALLAEYDTARWACNSANPTTEADQDAIGKRLVAAHNAILQARPTDPATLALQLRWILSDEGGGGGGQSDDNAALAHIAARLEAMAEVRAILLEELRHAGDDDSTHSTAAHIKRALEVLGDA